MTDKTLGQIGYETYLASGPNPGRTVNNLPMPKWAELAETEAGRITAARWEAAAVAMCADISAGVVRNGRCTVCMCADISAGVVRNGRCTACGLPV